MALLPSFTVPEEDACASQVSCYAKEHHEDNVHYSEASHEDRWSLKRDYVSLNPIAVEPTCIWSAWLIAPCSYHMHLEDPC